MYDPAVKMHNLRILGVQIHKRGICFQHSYLAGRSETHDNIARLNRALRIF